jgi:hypothetical protein
VALKTMDRASAMGGWAVVARARGEEAARGGQRRPPRRWPNADKAQRISATVPGHGDRRTLDDQVADAEPAHVGAACGHLGYAFVSVGKRRRERVRAPTAEGLVDEVHHGAGAEYPVEVVPEEHRVAIAARADERPHHRVGGRRRSGLGNVPPGEGPGFDDHELAHAVRRSPSGRSPCHRQVTIESPSGREPSAASSARSG